MSNFVLKENNGSAFLNTKKELETHADYTGTINVRGEIFWLNTWVNKDKNGNPYHTHKVKEKTFKPAIDAAKEPTVNRANPIDYNDDEIAF